MNIFKWFTKPKAEKQAADNGQTRSYDWDPRFLMDAMGGGFNKTLSGVPISNQNALRLAPYFACIKIISEDIAKLPFTPFVIEDDQKRVARTHPSFELLKRPNNEMTAFSFMETMVQYMLGWGNGIARMDVSKSGRVTNMDIIHPGRVRAKRIDGIIFYEVHMTSNKEDLAFGVAPPDQNTTELIPQEEILHFHGLGNGFWGYSMAAGLAGETVGYGLALRDFGSTFFGNSANGGFVLSHPGTLSEKAKEGLKRSVGQEQIGPQNAHKLKVLEEGMKLERITIPPNEAQFLEAMNFSIEEMARFFRCPLSKLQHLMKANFNTLEQQNRDYVTDTLSPHMVRIQQEYDWKIFNKRERAKYFTKFDTSMLLRGSQSEQSNFYNTQFTNGVLSINEIRQMEGLNPIDDAEADFHWLQLNMAPIEGGGHQQASQPETVADPEPEEPEEMDEPEEIEEPMPEEPQEPDTQARAFELKPIIRYQAQRMIDREVSAFSRISKKHENGDTKESAVNDDVNRFLASHRSIVFESFSSIFDVLDVDKAILSQFCVDYLDGKANLHKKGDVKGAEKDGFVNELTGQITGLLTGKE